MARATPPDRASSDICAYPDATVTIVRSALALEERLDMFAHRAGLIQESAFDGAWDAFLEDAQRFL